MEKTGGECKLLIGEGSCGAKIGEGGLGITVSPCSFRFVRWLKLRREGVSKMGGSILSGLGGGGAQNNTKMMFNKTTKVDVVNTFDWRNMRWLTRRF